LNLARVRRRHSWHSFIRSLQLVGKLYISLFELINPKEKYWPFFKSFYKGEEEGTILLANFASPIWNETKGGNITFLQPLEVEEFEYLAKNIDMTLWKHILKTYTHTWGKCKSQNIHNMK
jgi:hypothetical protein